MSDIGNSHYSDSVYTSDIYKIILESAPDMMWVLNSEYRCMYVNRAVYDMYGYTQEEAIGAVMTDATPPESLARVQAAMARRRQSMEAGTPDLSPYTLELQQRRKDGSLFWIETNSTPILGRGGEFRGVVGSSRDITAKKEAERSLARRVELEHAVSELASGFIGLSLDEVDGGIEYALDVMGRLLSVERGFIYLFRAEATGVDVVYDWCVQNRRVSGEGRTGDLSGGIDPELWETLARGDMFRLDDVAAPTSVGEELTAARLQARSLLVEPLALSGRIIGCLGFSTVTCAHAWKVEECDALRLFGKSLTQLLERRRVEEELARSRDQLAEQRARLELAMNMSRLALWENDIQENTFTFNDQFYDLYGTSAKREGGYRMSCEAYARELVCPEDQWIILALVDRLCVSRNPDVQQQVHHRIVRRDGRVRHVAMRYRLLRDSEGVPVKILGVNQDITDSKQVEEELARSRNEIAAHQARLALAMDLAGMAVWELDLDSGLYSFNDAFYTLYGTSAEREGGYRMSLDEYGARFVHPDDAWIYAAERERGRREVDGGHGNRVGHRIVRRDGDIRHVIVRYARVHGPDGRVAVLIGANQDVTDLKRAEAALARSREEALVHQAKLALAMDMAHLACWEYDFGADQFVFSEAFYALYGTSAGREGGLVMSASEYTRRFVHPDDMLLFTANCATVFASAVKEAEGQLEYRIIRRDGAVCDIVARYRITFDAAGNPIRGIGTNQDITERKRSEDNLLAAKHAAEAANRSKSEFLANMSHEIRTPLNGIMGMLQLVALCRIDDEAREYADTAIWSCQRLATLIGNILDLSRIEAGRLQLVSEPFSVQETVESVRKLFGPAATQAGLQLRSSVASDIPVLVGDCSRIHQILNNFVGNSIKFTERGSIALEAYALPERQPGTLRVCFQVSDTGIGIPDEMLGRLFTAFTQVDGSLTRRHQGAGLGLSIARRLIELMGGSLSVISESSVGTIMVFCASFSIAGAEAPSPLS